jgi:hypothetical protein
MADPIQGFIQTILQMRQLQMQEQAQEIQRQQLGLSRQQFGLQRQNAQAGFMQGFQSMLPSLAQPTSMLPFVGEMAPKAGVSPEALTTMIQQTPASTATTRGRAVQQGATPGMAQPAAERELLGQTGAPLAQDRVLASIFGQVGDYYSNLPPERQQAISAGVLQRLSTGQDVGEAAMSEATADFMGRAPQEVRDQIVQIGKGLAPSAPQDAQERLGWANYRLNLRQFETSSLLDDLRTKAAISSRQGEFEAAAYKEINDVLNHRSALLSDMTKNAATMTPEGVRSYAQQLNAYNQQLRTAAPTIYGPQGTHPLQDIGIDKTTSATGFAPFLKAWTSSPR